MRRKIGDRRALFSTLTNLAALAQYREDFVAAKQGQEEALTLARELEDRFAIGVCLINLGNTYLSLQNPDAARTCLTEGLQLHIAVGSRFAQAFALEGLAAHAAQSDDPVRAGLLLGAAQALRRTIQAILAEVEQKQLEARFVPVSTDPGFLTALETGRDLPLDEAISLALQTASPESQVRQG